MYSDVRHISFRDVSLAALRSWTSSIGRLMEATSALPRRGHLSNEGEKVSFFRNHFLKVRVRKVGLEPTKTKVHYPLKVTRLPNFATFA